MYIEVKIEIEKEIRELEVITSDEIKVGRVSYQQVPEPGELGAKLLKAAGVILPKVLPYQNVKVATGKKIS